MPFFGHQVKPVVNERLPVVDVGQAIAPPAFARASEPVIAVGFTASGFPLAEWLRCDSEVRNPRHGSNAVSVGSLQFFSPMRLPPEFAARRQYELREVAERIASVLSQAATSRAVVVQGSDIPNYPTCDSPMILRTASTGPKKGSSFFGCSNYPKCREIVPVE